MEKEKKNNEKVNLKSFEQSIKRLEEIVSELETEETPLEKTITLFEEGMQLAEFCSKKLEEVKHKVEIVIKTRTGLSVQPFQTTENSELLDDEDDKLNHKDKESMVVKEKFGDDKDRKNDELF